MASTTSSKTVVGFGANYNLNMGQAVRATLPHLVSPQEEDSEHESPKETEAEVKCFQLDKTPWNEEKDELIQVATSSASSVFLTQSGKVYTCGTLHGNVLPSLTQTIIQLPLKCVEVAAGRHFGLARMEGGLAVCSWGAGHFGQLALGGDSSPFIEHPTVIEALLPHVVGAPIATIAAGYWHAMAVTQAGSVYCWGCNRNAQCGFKPSKDPPTLCAPQLVRFETVLPPKMVKVSAGRSHSVALDETGKVYSWGSCQYGQCGILTRRRGGVAPPKQVESLSEVKISDIAAGDTHTLALTGGGRVFGFGSGFEGQLGTGSILQMNPKPKLVGDLDFVAIEAGREWKSQQKNKQELDDTVTTSETASDGSLTSSPHSSLSQIPKIVSLHAAGNSSMALSSKGHLYVWGCNDVGNLGVPRPESDQLPFAEPSVPPSKTSTLRQFHTQSFDSSHNIGLPQRVDCLGHLNITSIAASPTYMWCLGTPREGGDEGEANSVGRTLYELQEAKRQKSLRLHRPSVKKEDLSNPLALQNLESKDDQATTPTPMDPPEIKDGARVDAAAAAASASTKAEDGEPDRQLDHSASLDSANTEEKPAASRPPKSPVPTKTKKRFSIPKALGKMVQRASFNNSFKGDAGGDDNDKKGRKG